MDIYRWLFVGIILSYFAITQAWMDKTKNSALLKEEFRSREKAFLYVAFTAIIILTAFRSYKVGFDTRNYIENFKRIANNTQNRLDKNFEMGYVIYAKTISLFTHNPQVLLAISALITNIPVGRFIYKYSNNKLISVILYITIGAFTFQLTGIRQSIAMSLCVIAIDFAIERKAVPFVLMVILAYTFHRSAIYFLPVYILGNKEFNKRIIILSVISLVFIFGFNAIVERVSGSHYNAYVENMGTQNTVGGWTYISIMLIALLMNILFRFRGGNIKIEEQKYNQFFFAMLVFALVVYIVRYQMRAAERVSMYYRYAMIILLPNSISIMGDRREKFVVSVLCVLLAILLFYYWIWKSPYIYTPFWMYPLNY